MTTFAAPPRLGNSGMPLRERVLHTLLHLRQSVPFETALVTVTRGSKSTETPLISHGFTPDALEHILARYLPSFTTFARGAPDPEAFWDYDTVDWAAARTFRTSPFARELLLPAGLKQGTSLMLRRGPDEQLGTVHLNIADESFTDDQIGAVLSATAELTQVAQQNVVRRYAGLSEREMEVLFFLVVGHSNAEIAEELRVARRTVATHIENILQKLQVDNRVQAAVLAYDIGLWI